MFKSLQDGGENALNFLEAVNNHKVMTIYIHPLGEHSDGINFQIPTGTTAVTRRGGTKKVGTKSESAASTTRFRSGRNFRSSTR